MLPAPITTAQRKAAKAAGLSYLLTFGIVVYVNFGIHDKLIVDNNAAETARNILNHEQLFRIGITGDLIYCAGIVVLLTALYVILKPVSQGFALLSAILRLVWLLMWLAMTLSLFDAIRLIHGAEYMRPFETEKLQVLARLNLGTRFDYYYVGLLFGALASTCCAWLWLKSRYIPKMLAVFGLVSSIWCVACTLIFYIFPDFDKTINLWWFDTPMGIFDIVLSFWLIILGLKQPTIVKAD